MDLSAHAAARQPGAILRLGLFGGAFDPPHLAHTALATAAIDQLELDALHVLPTGGAWHKKRELSSAYDRLAMCRLAFSGTARVEVDDREIRRPGATYTIDTIEELKDVYPGASLYLLMGADQAVSLPSWHRWEEVVQATTISVADRAHPQSAGGTFRSQLSALGFFPRFELLELPPTGISATEIRRRVASGQSIGELVSPAVAGYIAQHHLYRTV
jgi:nicotinate-nucleotide adenylyltransferase